MTNIKEIAQYAGVSVSTVSRVMNNHPYVSPEKRKSVLQAIDQLNYSRNINAIHLSERQNESNRRHHSLHQSPLLRSNDRKELEKAMLSAMCFIVIFSIYISMKEKKKLSNSKMLQMEPNSMALSFF